jgi:hypothetical protein
MQLLMYFIRLLMQMYFKVNYLIRWESLRLGVDLDFIESC